MTGGSFIMNIKEKYKMQEIINKYLDWFKASTIITPIESADKETVKVSTMFLDSHNDGIEFYIQKINDNTFVSATGFDLLLWKYILVN